MKRILVFLIVLFFYVSSSYAQTPEKSGEKKSCPNCNKIYITEDIFCPQDGKKLISQTTETDTSKTTQEVKPEKSQEASEILSAGTESIQLTRKQSLFSG